MMAWEDKLIKQKGYIKDWNKTPKRSPIVDNTHFKGDNEFEHQVKEIIKSTTDESILVDIAKNNLRGKIRLEAVKKISDEFILADIAKNDSNAYVRMGAVRRIHNKIF